jgi:ribosomal protein S18 acetylase RimI-like enzyme
MVERYSTLIRALAPFFHLPERAIRLHAGGFYALLCMETFAPSGGVPMKVGLDEITIRNELVPGDLGYVIYLHGLLYGREYGFAVRFETYVARGIQEFYAAYDPERDRVWICEHREEIIGSLFLVHRENDSAQLRYFLIRPGYRGIGLGKKLMGQFMETLSARGYRSAFLWTTHELHTAAALYRRFGFELTEEKRSSAFGRALVEHRYDLKPPA